MNKKGMLLSMVNPKFSLKLKFDGNTLDSSGNGLHATAYNNPTYITGGGLQFNGIDQYVRVDDNLSPLLELGTESMTIGCQVKLTSSGAWGLIGKTISGATDGRYGVYLSSTKYIASVDYGNPLQADANINIDGLWHDVVVVFDRTNGFAYLYVDGVLKDSISIPVNTTDFSTGSYFYIGVYGNNSGTAPQSGTYLTGGIKNVFGIKAAMTGAEVADVFANF